MDNIESSSSTIEPLMSTSSSPIESNPDVQVDSIVRAVLDKFIARSKFGKEKYGTDLDRTDLSTLDWINHAQDELMDGILYLEKLKHTHTHHTTTTG
jgi:hypothetical protein